MFEVFAGMCFYGAMLVRDCHDYTVESYNDPLSCEIVVADYRRNPNWIDPACIPGPEVEPMP